MSFGSSFVQSMESLLMAFSSLMQPKAKTGRMSSFTKQMMSTISRVLCLSILNQESSIISKWGRMLTYIILKISLSQEKVVVQATTGLLVRKFLSI